MTIDKEKIFAEMSGKTVDEIEKELDDMAEALEEIEPVDIDAE